MSRTGTLVVRRAAGAHRDALRAYRVLVDGVERGRLRPGDAVEVELPPGRHVVRARIDWTGSPEVAVDVPARRRVELVVGPAGSAFRALLQIAGRQRYLRLGPPPPA